MKKANVILLSLFITAAIGVFFLFGCEDNNGLNSKESIGFVTCLTVYDGDLIAAEWNVETDISAVRRLDGSTWQTIGSKMEGYCYLLCTGNTDLYIVGEFTSVSDVAANEIACWTGETWSPLGSGLQDGSIWSMTSVGDILHVGGYFSSIGGVSANNIALWIDSTSEWSAMTSEPPFTVSGLVYDKDLYAFGNVIEGISKGRVSRYNGATWTQIGAMNRTIDEIIAWTGGITAAGDFDSVGNVAANHIATFDGSQWSTLGAGLSGDFHWIDAMAEYNSDLVIAGYFEIAGDITISDIARWDGSSWHAMGSGLNGEIYSFAKHNGFLVAGGNYKNARGITVSKIARWDGEEWTYE